MQTFKALAQLGYAAVFAPDSKLAAVPTAAGLRLHDSATAQEVALLEDPDLDLIQEALFTPDGMKVIAVSTYKGIHVSDRRFVASNHRCPAAGSRETDASQTR